MALTEYNRKRNFRKTPEPSGKTTRRQGKQRIFVVQKHAASRLHYDFRLELDGTLKSWAVPKGPSYDPGKKQLAVHVEDHPLDYAGFEGTIPQGEYGGGTVMVWDQGTWDSIGDPDEGYRTGKIKFVLHGEKLRGKWALIEMHGDAGDGGKNWLLIKEHDDEERPDFDVTKEEPLSVVSGRDLDQIAAAENGAATKKTPTKKNSRRRRTSAVDPPVTVDLSQLAEAKKGSFPQQLRPELATLVAKAPQGDNWLHEMKFDGYRVLAFLNQGSAKLITRNGHDWTDKFPSVAKAVETLPLKNGILDGEVVVLRPDGTPDFQRLQNAIKSGRNVQFVYYAFDLPYADGYDLREVPLEKRKEVLAELCQAVDPKNEGTLRYSEHIRGQGDEFAHTACRHHMEGIVSKRADSAYESRRSKGWVKTKCHKRQEFVIGGYTKPGGSRTGFGALLLGYYDGEELNYCGRVGTGFTAASLKDLLRQLKPLQQDDSPFAEPPTDAKRDLASWVEPKLVCEVEFTEWTSDGQLRHPSFKGLREDKPAGQIIREQPQPSPNGEGKKEVRGKKAMSKTTSSSNGQKTESTTVAGVSLSNPDRLLFPDTDITKQKLAEFYVEIADWVLPHVVDRPLTMVRCPRGEGEACFYQKHFEEAVPEGVTTVPIQEKTKLDDYVVIHDVKGLVSLVQLGVLEFHPWGARVDDLERPDRIIFDLDPGEGVDWADVVEGARAVRERLTDLGLESFLRTSGGKGLHVVIPLVRRRGWDEVKDFAHSVATAMMSDDPARYIDNMSKAKRAGKIFVDYLRNGRGATAVASYSTRARAGAPVATPLRWDELTTDLKPNQYTVDNLPQRLRALKGDPWENFFEIRQSLTAKMLQSIEKAASRR